MMEKIYKETFEKVTLSEEIKAKIKYIPEEHSKSTFRSSRKLSIAIVYCLAIVMITGTAVAVSYGGNLIDWFANEWKLVNGEEMSTEQLNVIDRLTTPVGQEQTIGNVTVTLDSVAYSNGYYWMLVKAEGVKFNERYGHLFRDSSLMIYSEDGTDIGWSWGSNTSIDDSGALTMLIDGELNPDMVDDVEGQTGDFCLSLTDLMEKSVKDDKDRMLQEGHWEFEFQIPLEEASKVLTAEPVEVQFIVNSNQNEPKIAICHVSNLEVSTGDIKYIVSGIGSEDAHMDVPHLILKNGYEIGIGGGYAEQQEDGSWKMQHQLRMPVDINQVKAVKLGMSEIKVE